MPDSLDAISELEQRDFDEATKPKPQPFAVVWVQNGGTHHSVLPDTTISKAKQTLEMDTGIDMFNDHWAIAHFTGQSSMEVKVSGHADLRDIAKQTLLDFDPNEPPLTIKEVHNLVMASSS